MILRTCLVPDANRANNLLAAPTTLQATLPTLPLSPPGITPTPVTGTITNAEQLVFQITIPANSVVQLTADTSAVGSAELLVGFGAIPSEGATLAQAFAPAQGKQQFTLTTTQAGTYYVVLVGQPTAGNGTSFRLTAQQLAFLLATVSPGSAGNTGSVTLKITGGALAATDTFKLLGPGGTAIAAGATQVLDGATVFATFNLTGAAVGTYDLQASVWLWMLRVHLWPTCRCCFWRRMEPNKT